MSLVFKAMQFARDKHAGQVRKYTGNPYADHLAEVAGIVAAATVGVNESVRERMAATAWLHDVMEDQGVTEEELTANFGQVISLGVKALSDMEKGNRAERKAASRARIAAAPWWVQTIKVADLISNTSSIVKHDPKFAQTYLQEKALMLDALTQADLKLVNMARQQIQQQWGCIHG